MRRLLALAGLPEPLAVEPVAVGRKAILDGGIWGG